MKIIMDKKFLISVGFFFLGFLLSWYFTTGRNEWSFFFWQHGTYEEPTIVIPGFKSKGECLKYGIEFMDTSKLPKEESKFNCGINCKEKEGLFICDRICYQDGSCRE